MNLNPLEQINKIVSADKTLSSAQSQDALRKAAEQFEAVLLTQLTSALNGTSEADDEDSLFGSDGGSGLAKQMFSEQLATTMAKSGGIGLADMMMQKFGAAQSKPTLNGKLNPLAKTISALKDIRENPAALKPLRKNNFLPLVNNPSENSVQPPELMENPANSTAAEDIAATGEIDNTVSGFTPDENVRNVTRPRIVPDTVIRDISETTSGATNISAPNNIETGSSPTSISGTFSAPKMPTAYRRVSYQIPVKGRISSGFGNRFHPIDKKIKFHAGVDIAVPKGTQVGAAADGVVKYAGPLGNYGNVVIIQHPDGRETRYGHLEKVLVTAGEAVSAGQQVAKSGSTGKSTGPHLHFEVRENGQVVNPFKILSNVLPKAADR